MSPARCASTRRSGICWIAITAWSRRRRRRNWCRASSSAFSSGRRPIVAPSCNRRSRAVRCHQRTPSLQSVAPAARYNAAPAKTRLVLRPFAMHGIDGDHGHLVQGFSQHLAACLVRFREWSVVDRPAAAVALPPPGAAPQYCIETTAYQAGAEINMVMVLRDEATGIYVWSESFRLGLDNWFETQQRIIRRIATSLNVQLSAERLMRLAGEPDVSLDLHDRWLRGQNLHDEIRSGKLAAGRHHLSRCDPRKSALLALLQQPRADEQHRAFRASRASSAISTRQKRRLNSRRRAVQLDPVDSRAHLCCGWSYVMALREAEAAPHMELACELNDNDPWTLLSSAHYCAFCGSIEQARLRAAPVAGSFAGALLSRVGLPRHHSLPVRRLCRRARGLRSRAMTSSQTLPAWRAAALFELGQPATAREEAQRFLNGIRSFWVGSAAPTDEAITRWLLQAHPISVSSRWEALRHSLRGAGLPVEGIVQLSW